MNPQSDTAVLLFRAANVNPRLAAEFRRNPCGLTLESAVTSMVIAYNRDNHAGRSYFAPSGSSHNAAADAAAPAQFFPEGRRLLASRY